MRSFWPRSRRGLLGAALAALGACAPHLGPLPGVPVPARLPTTSLGSHHRRLVFHWDLSAANFEARGEGAARIAPPDSVRLDFFLAGGAGGGAAVIVGQTMRLPRGQGGAGFLPAPPLLWAALGRLALPAVDDTVARVEGAVLRADFGRPVQWRATFDGARLARLERVEDGRVREWVSRTADGRIRYHHESDRRTLDLVINTSADTGPFDDSLWSFP